MADLLSAEDLAYMRESAAEARPTEGTYQALSGGGRDDMGGTTPGALGEAQPIQVRVDDDPDVPADLAGRYDVPLVKIVADLVNLPAGSTITANGKTYVVVSTYQVQEWDTAQVVWARPR